MKDNNLENILIENNMDCKKSDLSEEEDDDEMFRNSISMPEELNQPNIDSYYTSNFLGKIFFNWSRYAMGIANKTPLKIIYFKNIGQKDKSENLLNPLYEEWNKQKINKGETNVFDENTLFKSILKTYYKWIIILSIMNLCTNILKYVQIFFYESIIKYFEHYHNPKEDPPFFNIYINAIGLIMAKFATTFFHHQTKFLSELMGVKAYNAVTALLYDKIMKTSVFIKNQISEGEILNYIQVDSEKLNFLFTSLPSIITIPFNLVISFWALFAFFGWTFFAGILILIIIILAIWYVQYRYLENTKVMLKKKDKRMRLTTHTFHIIKILKLFGWEDEFRENIDEKRNDELINIKKILNLVAVRTFVNSNLSLLTSLASIGGYTYFFGAMDIKTLFTSEKLVKEVAEPMVNIPQYITDIKSLMISMNRVQSFLVVKDIDIENILNEESLEKSTESTGLINNQIAIQYENCDFGIKGEETIDIHENIITNNQILLKGINLTVEKEELVTMIGETGSGKTCLINCILQNLELLNSNDTGKEVKYYNFSPRISYASQDPWIMNGSIRDNIIFYGNYDEKRYKQVINACQLDKDFENLKHGDLTEVGSTGNNISGGQRARIALARAIYKEADIYLLDDPIPSVDTYISMKIFHQAILNFLKDKTRIYVTHDTRNLKYSNRVIVMNNFQIEFNGTYKEFSKKENYKYIVDENSEKNKKSSKINTDITDIKGEYFTNKDDTYGKLLRDEDQVFGKVTWRLYDLFFRIQGGYLLFSILLILTICITISGVCGKLFISNWEDSAKKDGIKKEENYKFFFQYSLIVFLGIVIQLIKEFLVALSNFKGTKNLHEKMIFSLIRAPINLFHDIVPIGQILNRLIHDLEMSQDIIWKFNTMLKNFIGLIISIYVCFMENRETIIISPIIGVLAFLLLRYFISAGRDLNRLNGTSRSPVISLFSETILGITTIRTFKQEAPSKEKFFKRLDDHFGVMLYRHGTDNWFCMHLDIVSHFYLTYVLIRAIFGIKNFDGKIVGIMLDYSSEFSEHLLELFEQSSQVEKSLISLERCDTYTHLPSENYDEEKLNSSSEDKIYDLTDKSWPNEGKVKYDNYSMKYRENCDLALRDINIEINPGEKIGIVGRTGSGKSSLALSLFRIIEAFSGKIEIDGYDIKDIPLKKLRRSLSIVPQEPFLLEGTLKTNLDPLNLYSENEIDEVLKNVKLYEMLEHDNINKKTTLNGINTEIKEYGNNISFGCRQLLCVARAILRKSKIIILDEATSSVDQKTEDIISTAVETMFKDSTVIIIAHRIHTVKKCDRIIVMNNGQIIEVGKPKELIENTNSKFYSLYYKYIEEIE